MRGRAGGGGIPLSTITSKAPQIWNWVIAFFDEVSLSSKFLKDGIVSSF